MEAVMTLKEIFTNCRNSVNNFAQKFKTNGLITTNVAHGIEKIIQIKLRFLCYIIHFILFLILNLNSSGYVCCILWKSQYISFPIINFKLPIRTKSLDNSL